MNTWNGATVSNTDSGHALSLGDRVKLLEERHRRLLDLCGTVLGTLTIERNREVLPPTLVSWADCWLELYQEIKAEEEMSHD